MVETSTVGCDRFQATLRLSMDVLGPGGRPVDAVDPVLLGHGFNAAVATRHAGAVFMGKSSMDRFNIRQACCLVLKKWKSPTAAAAAAAARIY